MLYEEYNSKLQSVSEIFTPVAITFEVTDGAKYTLKEFWEPESGANFEKSIREKFPEDIVSNALNYKNDRTPLKQENYAKAYNYFYAMYGSQKVPIPEGVTYG